MASATSPTAPSASYSPAAAPRTNDKVERFHQTMAREWAY
jgi:hypothetical protein